MDEFLRKLYYDPRSLGSLTNFVQRVRAQRPDIPIQTIRDWVHKQDYYQRRTPLFGPKAPSNAVRGKWGQWQGDLVFLYKGARQLPVLTLIHTPTRWAWAQVLPNQTTASLQNALDQGIASARAHHQPFRSFHSDNQFRTQMDAFLEKKGIESSHPSPGDKTSLSLIEAFNGTLRKLVDQYVETVDSDWPKALPDLIANYNDRRHTRLGKAPTTITPADVLRLNASRFVASLGAYGDLNRFVPGVRVRVHPRSQNPLDHKWKPHWSHELYTVSHTEGNRVVLTETGRTAWAPRDLKIVSPTEEAELEDTPLKGTKGHATRTTKRLARAQTKALKELGKTQVLSHRTRHKVRSYKDPIPSELVKAMAPRQRTQQANIERILSHEGKGLALKFKVRFQDKTTATVPLRKLLFPSQTHLYNQPLRTYLETNHIADPTANMTNTQFDRFVLGE